jgi:hypothetical protein
MMSCAVTIDNPDLHINVAGRTEFGHWSNVISAYSISNIFSVISTHTHRRKKTQHTSGYDMCLRLFLLLNKNVLSQQHLLMPFLTARNVSYLYYS